MNILTVLFFIFSSLVFSHVEHDWRTDYQAYLSISYELPTSTVDTKKSYSSRLDMDFFKEKLKSFSSSSDRKSIQNLDSAREFLKNEYEKIGFKVFFQPFGGGTNFIAEKRGTSKEDKILILSSHIDTVRCKGANDNATGTIGLLTVAQELAEKDFPHSVRILGFDKEEIGLVGSDAYVATLNDKKNIIGNINFEMMGVNSRKDGRFHVIDCQKESSMVISDHVRSAISDLGLPLSIVKACTDRSDHASFWRHNLPAIVISENFFGGDSDPCYHSSCDIVDDRLDYQYMGNILEAVLEASERLLQ